MFADIMLIFIKNIWQRFKKWIISIFGVSVALAAPFVQQDMKWIISYETIAFETADGDLAMNEWADAGNGEFYIREVPKDEGNFISTTSPNALLGKTEVQIRAKKSSENPDCAGCAYYSEFTGSDGKVIRVPYEGRYNDLKEIGNALQPKKTEWVSVLEGINAEAGIAFQTDTDTVCTVCSSASFSFTTSGSDRGLVVIGTFSDTTDADRDITASTYNSVSLTQGARGNDDANDITTEIWYLGNPDTGANTLSITLAGAVSGGYFNTSQYTGVLTTAMQDANNSATQANATSISYTITTVSDNTTIVDGATINTSVGTVTCEPNSGQTEILDQLLGSADAGCAGYELNQGVAGSKTVSWNCTGFGCDTDEDFTAAGMSLAPESEEPAESSTWWDTNFLYRRKITFNNASSQQTLTNFPLSVFLSENANDEGAPNNITYANVKARGDDIRFVDADQSTMLKHEIEKWNTSGTSTVWVKIPKLSATSTTDHIWMYYGNSATTSGAATTSVWSNGYTGVWHLNATSTAARKYVDSSSGNRTAISTNDDGTVGNYSGANPIIGGAIDLDDASTQYLITDTTPFTAVPGTICGFFRSDDIGNRQVIAASGRSTASANDHQFNLEADGSKAGDPVSACTAAGAGCSNADTTTAYTQNKWEYGCSTFTSATLRNSYINAGSMGSNTNNVTPVSINKVAIGARANAGLTFSGQIAEIRISNIVRSQDWMQAEYRYGFASSTTHTYGAEENVPTTGAANTSTSTIFKTDTIIKTNAILNYYWRLRKKYGLDS